MVDADGVDNPEVMGVTVDGLPGLETVGCYHFAACHHLGLHLALSEGLI